MNLLLFGATGGIGGQVMHQALDAGHTVFAILRRPEALTFQHDQLEIIKGDVLKAETFRAEMPGMEAVVSALGVTFRGPTTLYSAGVANILQVMGAAGVRRLLCIYASGLDPGPLWQRVIAKPVLWAILKDMYSDLERMEILVKASGLDWTILRPPRLTDGPRSGRYQVAINQRLSHGSLLSRADVADFILKALSDPTTYRAKVEIAY